MRYHTIGLEEPDGSTVDVDGIDSGTQISTVAANLPSLKTAYFRVWARDESGIFSVQSDTASAFVSPFTFETVAGAAIDAGGSRSIAVDKNGDIHIAYNDGTAFALLYNKRTSGSWGSPETVEGDPVTNISLALDAAGGPHISYKNIAGDNYKYAYKSGTWFLENIETALGV